MLGRVMMSLATAATLLFIGVLWRWNLVGFNY
jgi:hypothetical protein